MLDDLAKSLGHVFADMTILAEATTHGSAAKGARNYERLEFLGDRVLGLAISELLLERFPKENEGALALRFVGLVRAEAVAEVAEAIGLGDHLALSSSARNDGAKGQISMLADACEAVIGALYLDGGLEPARMFVRRHWADAVEASGRRPPQDPKTSLQEWLQGRGLGLPKYAVVSQ